MMPFRAMRFALCATLTLSSCVFGAEHKSDPSLTPLTTPTTSVPSNVPGGLKTAPTTPEHPSMGAGADAGEAKPAPTTINLALAKRLQFDLDEESGTGRTDGSHNTQQLQEILLSIKTRLSKKGVDAFKYLTSVESTTYEWFWIGYWRTSGTKTRDPSN